MNMKPLFEDIEEVLVFVLSFLLAFKACGGFKADWITFWSCLCVAFSGHVVGWLYRQMKEDQNWLNNFRKNMNVPTSEQLSRNLRTEIERKESFIRMKEDTWRWIILRAKIKNAHLSPFIKINALHDLDAAYEKFTHDDK